MLINKRVYQFYFALQHLVGIKYRENNSNTIMTSLTQTMETQPKQNTFLFMINLKEEKDDRKLVNCQMKNKTQRAIEIAKRYYNNNFEYVQLQKRIWLDKKYEQRKEII